MAKFDVIDRKQFSFLNIVNVIRLLPEGAEQTCEQLAFVFGDGLGYKCWRTYYGPIGRTQESEGSNKAFFPDISMITLDTIAYWENVLKRFKIHY